MGGDNSVLCTISLSPKPLKSPTRMISAPGRCDRISTVASSLAKIISVLLIGLGGWYKATMYTSRFSTAIFTHNISSVTRLFHHLRLISTRDEDGHPSHRSSQSVPSEWSKSVYVAGIDAVMFLEARLRNDRNIQSVTYNFSSQLVERIPLCDWSSFVSEAYGFGPYGFGPYGFELYGFGAYVSGAYGFGPYGSAPYNRSIWPTATQ